jgi:CelD/BcsL family acetyltransferase involved in cellulose biosynthesis
MFKRQFYRDFYLATAMALPQTAKTTHNLNIHVAALYLNDHIIATHWGINFRNIFYYLMPAYESGEPAKYSPGKILLLKLIEWCFQHEIKTFDFTFGGEAYKKDWCNSEMKLYQYFLPVSIKGKFILFLINLIRNYRRKPVWINQ